MENTYRLNVGGKETIVKGCNLQSAINKEKYDIRSIEHENSKKLNGKYIIRCNDGTTIIYAEWVEKVNKLKANQ